MKIKNVFIALFTVSLYMWLSYLESFIKVYIKSDVFAVLISATVGACIMWLLFLGWHNYLWKVKSVLRIMPNISGKYKIKVESTYGGGTIVYGEMIIRQYDKNIHVECEFENSATSFSKGLICEDKGSGTWEAFVVYTNKPKNCLKKDRWETHDGNMVMHNISNKKITECKYVNYDRDTKGKIKCEYIEKKKKKKKIVL